MIMAAVRTEGHGPIVVMKRDDQAQKGGYSARSWQWAMEDMLPQLPDNRFYLLQDNAPIQVAKSSRKWLRDHKIEWVRILPYSPNLNCIKHA